MSDIRENLLGYVLGALEPAEMAEVEHALQHQPELHSALQRITWSLTPLGFPDRSGEHDLDGPPVGLVQRTLHFIEETEDDLATGLSPAAAGKLSQVTPAELAREEHRFSWVDWIVAATVLLAAGTLLFPAIASSRHAARVTACQNNLRELGTALEQFTVYSPTRAIPAIPVTGNRSVAGIYGATLKEAGLLSHDSLLVCPGSDLAVEAASRHGTFAIPTLAQIDAAVGETLTAFQRSMGGSYGYNLGYMDQGEHQTPTFPGAPLYPVMSDAPGSVAGVRKTRNHSARGHNMLYGDNHVSYVVNLPDTLLDDPFHNRSGMIAAGEDLADVVLGESNARPMPVFFRPR